MTISSEKDIKPIIIWLFAGCFLIYAMVVIGGMTRLTHSGLSMVEWNMIVGSKPPMSDADWQIPFEKYKLSPEYKQVNYHFTLEEFKSIYWWEYIHRFLGRMIGLVFLLPFIYFRARKKLTPDLFKKLIIILILGGFQGVLGWYMVKSGLSKEPRVSHYRLAAHLISAFTVFGFTFWTALSLKFKVQSSKLEEERKGAEDRRPETEDAVSNLKSQISNLKRWSVILFCTVILQIIYGAFVAGLKAGYLCPTWPKMCDEWVHDSMFVLQPWWRNFIEGRAGVQFVHRYIAYAVVIIVGLIYYKARKIELTVLQKRIVNALVLIVLCQFLLGVFTLLYSVPVLLGVLHQTGAFFLFGTSLLLINRLR
ncbi:MAG: COX15/CtaA family protein [Bacteroidetes bacterium]|nr:COX15/CtaA family protein [Bacteroidota bacterium]